MRHFETIREFNDMLGVETLHPLVSVVNLSKAKPMQHMRHTNGFYSVMLKDEISRELGFQYPQHLSRFFKKETGMTPAEYRTRIA